MRSVPSRRMVSPLSMTFSTICQARDRTMPEISLTDLMAYFNAVRTVTRQYLDQATDADEEDDLCTCL